MCLLVGEVPHVKRLREICDFDPTKKTSSKIDFTIDLLEKIKLNIQIWVLK